jgi:hypothetical protein
MKPRDAINRMKKLYFAITGLGFFALVVIAYLEKYLPQSLHKAMAMGAGAVFAAGILLLYFGIRCPKCGAILGLKYVFAEETFGRCSRCGIGFDEDSS